MSLGYKIFRNKLIKTFRVDVSASDKERQATIILPNGIEESLVEDNGITMLIYNPKNKNKRDFPVIFDIHGGAWCYGSKELNRPFNLYLAELGFVVISLDYRLVDDVTIVEQVQDLSDALNYAYENKGRLDLNFSNGVYLTGDSAGGMLAGVMCSLSLDSALQKLFDRKLNFKFDGLVLNHPAGYTDTIATYFNFKGILQRCGNKWFSRFLYGKHFKKSSAFQRTANFNKMIEGLKFPKTLIITSTGDPQLSVMAKDEYEALMKNGCKAELYVNEKEPNFHVFNVLQPDASASKETNQKIKDFLIN